VVRSPEPRGVASERGSPSKRFFDRALGIPLVSVLGALRTKRKSLPRISLLGLLETAAIGDTVLLAGVIPDLRASLPGSHVVLFTGSSNFEAALLLGGLDEVVRLPIGNPLETVRMLRERSLDVLLDFSPWPRIGALYSLLSGARLTVGFRTSNQYRHYGYDRCVDHLATVHELENYRSLVRSIDVESKSLPAIAAREPLIGELHSRNYLVFHAWPAGYRSHLKEWPQEYWCELAARVFPTGLTIVLTGARSEAERTEELLSRIRSSSNPGVVSLAGRVNLAQTVTVLGNAAAVVSVNTGIVHLAAAVGAPIISLNGPTSATRWGPLGPRAISVNAEAQGCGYLNLGFEYENQRENCMSSIRPERVFLALRELLQETVVRAHQADVTGTSS
jgi:lipopolysaccharide heptosyltransferase III